MRVILRATVSAGELARARCAATIAATVSVTPNSLSPLHVIEASGMPLCTNAATPDRPGLAFSVNYLEGLRGRARAVLFGQRCPNSRQILLAHDLLGKPLHTFPDHALAHDL